MFIVYCPTQATEGADEESMEAVSEAEATVDAGDSDLVRGSPPRLSEHAEEDNFDAAEKETESKESEDKETEAAVDPSPAPVSPQNPSPPQSAHCTDETFSTVLVHGGEAGSPSESGYEGTEVKTEEEMDEENVVVKDKSLQEGEGTDVDTTSDCKKETKNTDSDSKEDAGTQQEEESHGHKLRVSTADDLDEMMDIGTVDQVEQEAQMKAEEPEVESSRSPTSSNTGKMKLALIPNYSEVCVLNM